MSLKADVLDLSTVASFSCTPSSNNSLEFSLFNSLSGSGECSAAGPVVQPALILNSFYNTISRINIKQFFRMPYMTKLTASLSFPFLLFSLALLSVVTSFSWSPRLYALHLAHVFPFNDSVFSTISPFCPGHVPLRFVLRWMEKF